MKTMHYRKFVKPGYLWANIDKVFIKGREYFVINYTDEVRGSLVTQYFTNFWEAESILTRMGYEGVEDRTYKGIAIRWRERGIHNTMDAVYKDGYYMFLPPFPGTIFYDAATIEEAKAEIDRLENLSNC